MDADGTGMDRRGSSAAQAGAVAGDGVAGCGGRGARRRVALHVHREAAVREPEAGATACAAHGGAAASLVRAVPLPVLPRHPYRACLARWVTGQPTHHGVHAW
jgi:hypothetical protein